MNILKKRVNGTAIVLIDGKLYTKTNVSDSEWIEIVDKIDDIKSSIDEQIAMSPKFKELIMIFDEKAREEERIRNKAVADAIGEDNSELDKIDRFRKAKRVVDISGIFEYDENGFVYLKGFGHIMPKVMIDAILDAHYNPSSEYTVSSLLNFWKYLLLNPDRHVRNGLFEWIKSGKFSITEDGNLISYRNVDIKSRGVYYNLSKFVSESWAKVKRNKKSPKNYDVLLDDNGDYYLMASSFSSESSPYFIGNLNSLNNIDLEEGNVVYKPQHKGPYGQEIVIGMPVKMPRSECDNDPSSSCSRGLHAKSSKYQLNLGSEVLVILVNPYNIVAIPDHDTTKFRCCEYYPVSRAEINNGSLVEFNPGTYDIPYNGLESLVKILGSSSIDELKSNGVISNEISFGDMGIIMDEAEKIISKRVIKV